jgi:hypothetical protein
VPPAAIARVAFAVVALLPWVRTHTLLVYERPFTSRDVTSWPAPFQEAVRPLVSSPVGADVPANCHQLTLNSEPLPPVNRRYRSWVPLTPLTGQVTVVQVRQPEQQRAADLTDQLCPTTRPSRHRSTRSLNATAPGQVIDVLLSEHRDAAAARRFVTRALATLKTVPVEVVTDAAPVYPSVLTDLIPAAWHHVERFANNPIEADHSRLKHRLRPMRGLRTAQTVIAGHVFVQNLRRGHYELAIEEHRRLRVAAAFAELAQTI